MDRVYKSNTSETPPVAPATAGGYPREGSSIAGVSATVPGPYWFYSVTEEIRNAISASGLTPDKDSVTQLARAMQLLAHPVGSIYLTFDPANPATTFGGTWVQIGEGRCLVAAGATMTVGSMGGSATHTLTVNEMPSHNHGGTSSAGGHTHTRGTMNITGQTYGEGGGSSDYGCYKGAFYIDNSSGIRGVGSGDTDSDNRRILFEAARSWSGATSENGSHTHTVTAQGGGQAIDIRNPYLAVYMWKRTA